MAVRQPAPQIFEQPFSKLARPLVGGWLRTSLAKRGKRGVVFFGDLHAPQSVGLRLLGVGAGLRSVFGRQPLNLATRLLGQNLVNAAERAVDVMLYIGHGERPA